MKAFAIRDPSSDSASLFPSVSNSLWCFRNTSHDVVFEWPERKEPLSFVRQHLSYGVCLELRLSELFCVVLYMTVELFCVVLYMTVVHNHKHTLMSSSYSSLDWV